MAEELGESPIHSNPRIMGGKPVFRGSRVPISVLFDHLYEGEQMDQFLDNFPTVTREQAVAALKFARELMEDHACSCESSEAIIVANASLTP